MHGFQHLGKVRVAGSNPVVRSRNAARRTGALAAPSRRLGASSCDDRGGSDGEPPGQLYGLSCVRCGERSGVVLGRGLEPQQLGQLASRISSIVTRGRKQTESFDVLASCALADEGAGDGIARANPGGHCAAGSDIPSAGVEAFDCSFEPRLRFGQVRPGVAWGDGVTDATAWSHRVPPTRSSNCEPTSTIASRRTARQKSRPSLVCGPALRRSSSSS